jgi:hypothetical protein
MGNIYQYIVGQTRYILYKINPKLIPLHIREQVGERQSACFPICLYEARCCGCKAPNVFFAPKGCMFNNYPELMCDFNWEYYKIKYKERMNLLQPVFNELNEWPFSVNVFYIMRMSLYDLFTWRDKYKFTVTDVTDGDDFKEEVSGEFDFSKLNNYVE